MVRSTPKSKALHRALEVLRAPPPSLDLLAVAEDDQRQYALIGNIGDRFFAAFQHSPEYADTSPHSLDRYSRRVLISLSGIMPAGSQLIMPSDEPYAPFQKWAKQDGFFDSPLGILIHPEYGLWTAFRGAWQVPLGTFTSTSSSAGGNAPCDNCADKPCLKICPVTAFTKAGLDSVACCQHLDDPLAACHHRQCLARLACPIAQQLQYSPPAGQFFLGAFHRALTSS